MKKTEAIILAHLQIRTETKKTEVFPEIGRKALLAFFLLMVTTMTASAQKTAVLDAFSKHDIDAGLLNADNLQQPDDYAFELKQTVIAADKQTTTLAKFDPSGSKEEQWTVVSVDGKSPSKSDISTFRKSHSKQPVSNKADESSYRVEKETPDYLVISYKPDAESVDKDAAFIKDCRMYMTVNLKTKKLEKVQAVNEKPLKIKILKAEKFDLVVKYNWNEEGKRYLPVNEDINIQAKFLGQAVTIQTISAYSNYLMK